MINPTDLEIASAFTRVKLHLPDLTEREVVIFCAASLAIIREAFGTSDEDLLEAVEEVQRNISPVFHATH